MGAATWIGTLGTVVFVGLRHVECLDPRTRVRVVAVLVIAFSPVALPAATALFIFEVHLLIANVPCVDISSMSCFLKP